jgi:hypothetical protein
MSLPWEYIGIISVVDELLARAMRCDCGSYDTPLCAECECLLTLVSAAGAWAYLVPEDAP